MVRTCLRADGPEGQTGARITCAQALGELIVRCWLRGSLTFMHTGNEIYVGTSNGELFQFMQVDGGQVSHRQRAAKRSTNSRVSISLSQDRLFQGRNPLMTSSLSQAS